MKTGARNNLVGKVTEIKKGDLMSQVKFEISADSMMSSVMTVDSLNNLDIKEKQRLSENAKNSIKNLNSARHYEKLIEIYKTL